MKTATDRERQIATEFGFYLMEKSDTILLSDAFGQFIQTDEFKAIPPDIPKQIKKETKMKDQLKLCPCCNGHADIVGLYPTFPPHKVAVKCETCGLQTDYFKNELRAVEAWNTRHSELDDGLSNIEIHNIKQIGYDRCDKMWRNRLGMLKFDIENGKYLSIGYKDVIKELNSLLSDPKPKPAEPAEQPVKTAEEQLVRFAMFLGAGLLDANMQVDHFLSTEPHSPDADGLDQFAELFDKANQEAEKAKVRSKVDPNFKFTAEI